MKTDTAARNGLIVVAVAIFTDMLVYGIVVPILPSYALSLGVSQTAVGLLFASYAVALLVATPIFGILSDRTGRKGPMLWGLLGLAASTLFYAFASKFWMLIAARSLQGVSAAITWTAGFALLADLFPPEKRGKAMGIALSGESIGMLIGPSVGGWLFQLGGYTLPFIVAACFAILDGILRLILIKDVPHEKSGNPLEFVALFKNGKLLPIVGVVIVGAAIPCVMEPTLPLRLENELGLSAGFTGMLFAVPILAYAAAAPTIGSASGRVGSRKLMLTGMLLTAVFLPLTVVSKSIWFTAVFLGFLGIGIGLSVTPSLPEFAQIAQESGTNSFGASFSIYNTAYSLGMMLGPTLGGVLSNYFGILRSYLLVGAVVVIYAAVFAFTGRKKRSTAE